MTRQDGALKAAPKELIYTTDLVAFFFDWLATPLELAALLDLVRGSLDGCPRTR
jgi:hypothetical protein